MAFKDYCADGKCDVCGKEDKIVVCASTMGAISFGYCEECFNKRLEPYGAMVAYIACAGRFPEDINESYRQHVRDILKGLGKTEEQFIIDVNKDIEDMNSYFEEMSEREEDDCDEGID
jgi:hypothetical protein